MTKVTFTRRAGVLAALAAIVASSALTAPTAAAGAAPSAPGAATAAATSGGGWLRLGHFSPDTVAVDVRISALSGGTVLLEVGDVAYGDISGYQALPEGTYAISMIPAGSGDWTQLAVSDSVTVGASAATTVAAYGPADDLRVQAFTDDLTAPSAGNARIRVIQASIVIPTVDANTTTGVTIAEDAQSGTATPYAEVPAGTVTVQVTGGDATAEAEVAAAAGTITSLFVLDTADGGLTVIPILDSAGAPLVPYGGVDTGGGWLADTHDAQPRSASPRFALSVY